MNFGRIVAAALAAMVVYFAYGCLIHGLLIANDYTPYPEGVYRAGESAQSHLPFALGGSFLAMLVFATLYARTCAGKSDIAKGARQGLLFGIFMVGAFVGVNFGTVQISGRLALELAVSAPIEWTLVGIVVALVYRPVPAATT